jgi:molybdopterin synthase catalytic subunit
MTQVTDAGRDVLWLGPEAIDLAALVAEVEEPRCGAIATFLGTVRSPNDGQDVRYIDYQGYDAMIRAEMERIAAELREAHDVRGVVLAHRLGRLAPGVASIAIVVSSEHRGPALVACSEAIELCKQRLPVWKYEVGQAREGFVAGRNDAAATL